MKKTMITLAALTVAGTSVFAASTAACKGCHGQNFEKKAMNVSKIVKEMSKADIVTALKGYKDGSYGGNMKGIMAGQVKALDDAAIEAIATEIAGDDKKVEAVKEKATAPMTDAVVDAAKEKATAVVKEAASSAVDTAKAKATEAAAGTAAKMMMK